MTINVLLVEDDDLDRESTRRALLESSVDMEVHEVTTVAEARELLSEGAFECALVDLSLPDGGGLEVLGAAPRTAVVVLTGADDSLARSALDQGAQDYLLKDRLDPYWLGRSVEYAIERKRLQIYQRAAEHRDRLASLGQLAASVAHEINNPIAFIAAHLEALGDGFPAWRAKGWVSEESEAELSRVFDDCADGLARVAQIVRQLRGFARRPDEEEPVKPVDMAEVARWALALTRTQLTHTARVDERIAPCPTFSGRPGRLSQVITNLLVNAAQALEAANAEPVIRLTVSSSGHHVVTTVEDSGSGLSPEAIGQAFEPFFTTKGPGKGTGLGLSVAKEIVYEHGGELLLGTSPLGGLKATVQLPLQNQLERQRPSTVAPRPDDSSRVFTVLVVDDEPALRRAYQRLLRPHQVHAMDSLGALHWLKAEDNAQSVDAVICDVMMPDLDGRAMYEAALKFDPSLAERFVFCSGGAFREGMRRFLNKVEVEGVPVLLKPVSRDALIEAISRVVT